MNTVYYVTATGYCPTIDVQEIICHPLSYYTKFTNWSSNITLIFLPGEHIMTAPLYMSFLNNVSIKGEDRSVRKFSFASKPVILCREKVVTAFYMYQIKSLYIKGLRINCSVIEFDAVSKLVLADVTAQSLALGSRIAWYADSYIVIDVSQFNNTVKLYGKSLFLQITHTTISGGMLYILCQSESKGIMILENVSVIKSYQEGIAIWCRGYCSMNFTGVTIIASYSTGLYTVQTYGQLFLTDITIRDGKHKGMFNKGYESTTIFNNVTISNNKGGGMIVFDAHLSFRGRPSIIINNYSPSNGGGLEIGSHYSAIDCVDTEVYFINNTAQGKGGAIYFAEQTTKIGLTCTFDKNFKPKFAGNNAILAGSNVYNGIYWNCTTFDKQHDWINVMIDFISIINCSNNPTLDKFPRPLESYIASDALGVCLCSNVSNCSIRSYNEHIYPGQFITLSLVTVGVCGGISPAVLATNSEGGIKVSLGTINQQTDKKCKNFTYQIKHDSSSNGTGKIKVGLDQSLQIPNNSALIVDVTLLPCPHGLELNNGMCQCTSALSSVNNVKCDVNLMPHPISKSSNSWLYYNKHYSCTVGYVNCPFDYCNSSTISFSLNDPDIQCANNRSGILCGACQQGLSLMLGSNKCSQCSNKYISLILPFVVAGIILIAFLLVCNLTVSVGSINGLLFYANMMKLNMSSISVRIPVLDQFIAWINLDLGIETCFFNGLDGYWKTWLQYCFSVFLIALLILCCKLSTKLAHYLGRNVVAVLSTLIFMAHSKLLLAIKNSLMLSVIECEGEKFYVWSVDGNISYLGHKHISLFIVSLFFMLAGLLYTITIFSSQWMQRFCGRYCRSSWDPFYRFKPFIDAYTGPYKDKYRYWTGLLLIIRLLLTTVFSYTTGTLPIINNYIIAFTSAILIYLLAQEVYRNKIFNRLELFYMVNLGSTAFLLALLDKFELNDDIPSTTIMALSISLSMSVFICTVLVHLYIVMKRFCSSKLKFIIPFKFTEPLKEEEPLLKEVKDITHALQDEELYPSVINEREQLIFY